MAKVLDSVALTAPASDPNVNTGQTFQVSATYTEAGHGGEESVNLHWEYSTSSGGPYTPIPTSGALSTPTNPTQGADSGLTHSATITANAAGTYYVHVRAVGVDSAASFENGNQVATVNFVAGSDELSGQSLQSTANVSSVTVGQEHSFSGQSLESATQVTSTTASETHSLSGNALETVSQVTSTPISETSALSGSGNESATNISIPSISQKHNLAGNTLNSSSNVTSAAVSESGVDNLSGQLLNTSANVTSASVGQEHSLSAVTLDGATEVTTASVTQDQSLSGGSLEVGTEVSSATLEQGHSLGAAQVEAVSEVAVGSLAGTVTLTAGQVETAATVASATITQAQSLNARSLQADTEVASATVSISHALTGQSVQTGGTGLPEGNWVDIDDPVTIAQIADAVAAKFNFNGQGDVLATLDDEQVSCGLDMVQLNRIVQAAIPSPPSNAAIAKEMLKHLPKQNDLSKELKVIAQKIQKLSKPEPKSRDAAEIKQLLRIVLSNIQPTDDSELLDSINGLYQRLDQLPKGMPEIPDNTAKINDIEKQIDAVLSEVLENRNVLTEEIQGIEKPDLSQLVTKDELAAVSSILSKLKNYDDASVISMLGALREDSEAIQNNQSIQDQKIDLMLDNQIGF